MLEYTVSVTSLLLSGNTANEKFTGGGYLGSPQVSVERLAGPENLQAIEELKDYLHHDNFDAFMSIEVGGACGLLGMVVGSSKHYNVPAVDADWMGMFVSASSSALRVICSGNR